MPIGRAGPRCELHDFAPRAGRQAPTVDGERLSDYRGSLLMLGGGEDWFRRQLVHVRGQRRRAAADRGHPLQEQDHATLLTDAPCSFEAGQSAVPISRAASRDE